MSAELEAALALVFRKFREETVSENDLVKAMSLTLGWTKPSSAPNLLARGVQEGLVERTGDGFRPTFAPNSVDVPFGFKPAKHLFDDAEMPAATTPHTGPKPAEPASPAGATDPEPAPDRPALEALLDAIAGALELDRKEAVAKVNAKQQALENAITLDACALLVAAEAGIPIDEHAARVLEGLASRSG